MSTTNTNPSSRSRLAPFLRRAAGAGVLLCSAAALAQPGTTLSPAPAGPSDASLRFGIPTPKPRTPGQIRLATYNLENLFDDKDDPELSGEHEDKDETKPADHCKAAADAIRRIDADIIALQEIESREALIQFRDTYLKDAGYEYVISIDAGDERGIEQAVLSRFPLKDAKVWLRAPLGGTHPEKWGNRPNNNAGKPITFHRSPLCVTVEVPASASATVTGSANQPTPTGIPANDGSAPYELTLFVVHQKSGSDGTYWREKEAAKVVELAGELTKSDPNRNIIILGDFNATMGQTPMRTYTGAGFNSAFYPRLPNESSPSGAGDSAPKKPGSNTDAPRERRGSDPLRVTHESGRIIDHILLNEAAMKELVVESRFVLAMPARPEGADWRVTPPPTGYASDHYPVVIDLVPKDK